MKISPLKHRLVARGFGLVELMVAIAIGLIMSLALSYFFLGSQKSSRVHDDSSRMQENARNALDIMGRAIRQAGYTVDYKGQKTTPFDSILASNGASATTPDGITVSYEGQVGGETDCAGTPRASGVPLVFAFAVNSSMQLTCNNGTDTVVVADNVENLQITYGSDKGVYPERTGTVNAYADNPTDVRKVAVVKVILTMRGSTADTANGGTDGYVRQTYSASYTVRNQAG